MNACRLQKHPAPGRRATPKNGGRRPSKPWVHPPQRFPASFWLFWLLLAVPAALLLSGCGTDAAPQLVHLLPGPELGPWITVLSLEPFQICIRWVGEMRLLQSGTKCRTVPEQDGRLHLARMELAPGETASVTLAPGFDGDFETHLSCTAPQPGEILRVAIVGDFQPVDADTRAGMELVLAGVARQKPHLVVQLGDAVDDGSRLPCWVELLKRWPGEALPMAWVPGNHDLKHGGAANWDRLFAQPMVPGLDGRHRVLAFQRVRLFLLQMFDAPLSSRDEAWLARELARAQEENLWRFVFLHGTLVSSGTEPTYPSIQAQLIPLFLRMGVHAVFCGHDHFYEHTLLAGPESCTHLFVSGGAGARLEHAYGLLDRAPQKVRRRVPDPAAGTLRNMVFERRPWNPQRFHENVDARFTPGGKAWFHSCPEEGCQDEPAFFGQRYAENTLHFLTLEIDGDQAVIAARYPDGNPLAGPDGGQVFRLSLQDRGTVAANARGNPA